MLRDIITQTVSESLKHFENESGSVLYSSPATLKLGSLYIIGLNPGGDPSTHPISVKESLVAAFERPSEKYSPYVDEFWGANGTYSRHQKNVQSLAKICGKDIKDIFSANFIFVRSIGTAGIKDRIFDLATACWPVHKLFLSIVRPKLILCLGNGDGISSFSLLLDKAGIERSAVRYVDQSQSFRHGKYCNTEVSLGPNDKLKCTILGLPHPSWHGISKELAAFIESAK